MLEIARISVQAQEDPNFVSGSSLVTRVVSAAMTKAVSSVEEPIVFKITEGASGQVCNTEHAVSFL